MAFEFTGYDEKGMPTHVCTNDGFMQTSRKFNIETDGWMLDQLDYRDFPAIETGIQIKQLVDEVNHLRRRVFSLEKLIK